MTARIVARRFAISAFAWKTRAGQKLRFAVNNEKYRENLAPLSQNPQANETR
jgi:hypothetical protein